MYVMSSVLLMGSLISGNLIPSTSDIVWAQETDITQTPNNEQAGIQKSLDQQIGVGRGNFDDP